MNKHKPNDRRRPRTRALEYAAGFVLLAFIWTGCGGDDVAPNPSISGVCDFDRELDDCFADVQVRAHGDEVESWKDICEIQCRNVKSIRVNVADRAQLQSLRAFDSIQFLRVLNSRPDVTDLSFLSGHTTFAYLDLNGNKGLKTLAGLESLETIQPVDGTVDVTEFSQGLDITDSSLEEISLPSFRLGIINISGGSNLKTVDTPSFEDGYIQMVGTGVRTIHGANQTTAINGGIRLERNINLTTLDAFQNLEYTGGFTLEDNSSLPCEEIEPIASGLDTGEFPFVVSGNKETCDL